MQLLDLGLQLCSCFALLMWQTSFIYGCTLGRNLWYGNLQTVNIEKWATSMSTQLSTNVCIKLLLLLEIALNSILRPSNY